MAAKQPLVSLTALDGSGSSGRIRISTKSGITAIEGLEGGDDLRFSLSPLTGAVFVQQSISFRTIIDNPSDAVLGSDCGYVAVLIFTTTDDNQLAMVDIPAIRPDMVLQTGINAGLVLNTDDPAVSAFVASITSGIWCNILGFDIVDLAATIVERRKV